MKRGDEWTDHTEWFSVVLFGKRAEGLSKLLGKGAAVMVEGPMRPRSWEARDGSKRTAFEVNATDVLLPGLW